ncbi:MAG: YegP family protein [Bacteroidota bacterium]
MQNPKFQIFKSTANGQFYFRLRAMNGEIILASEGYTTKQGCLNGIQAVKVNAPFDSRYDRRKSINGQYYFVLKASNGEIIGTSEMYTTEYARENGIQAVKRDAPHAPVEDLTLATV